MSDLTPFEKNGKKKHLLKVAERLFAHHGFEAVSLRQLVEEANVNIAMVKYYFGSKDGLFEALIDEKFPRTREQINELANSSLDPWGKLLK
ncbi:MAG TPA: helix-turn-helix domain-containing protein, partial [Saprospiraceae bacterium]|nr:helix-turn-helix domain-containing protein [Saprospiraceae bacterium]